MIVVGLLWWAMNSVGEAVEVIASVGLLSELSTRVLAAAANAEPATIEDGCL
jgi:hypothetical protein